LCTRLRDCCATFSLAVNPIQLALMVAEGHKLFALVWTVALVRNFLFYNIKCSPTWVAKISDQNEEKDEDWGEKGKMLKVKEE
jgi:hypothetical protein